MEAQGQGLRVRQDPRAGTQRDPHKAHYGVGQGKFTSTLTSKILFEAGYSSSYQHWTGFNQPEVKLDAISPTARSTRRG